MIWSRKKKGKYVRASTNKKLVANLLGINRKSIYYKSIKDRKDEKLKAKIEDLHKLHPAYGHKRVSLALKINKKRVSRVMNKFRIKPPRRRIKKLYLTKSINNCSYTNIIRDIQASKPNQIYVSDLTYIKYQGRFVYLGTVEDIFTREIVSADLSDKHDSNLALKIVEAAFDKNIPEIFHTDQGSEFMAERVTSFIESKQVKVSVSDKASPWQNGFKESFFDKFKVENGDLNRFEDLGELVEEIYSYINYHNKYRIHTSLKMTPLEFKQNFSDTVSRKRGT